MIENPWQQLPDEPPYVLPDDKTILEAHNKRFDRDNRFHFHIDRLLPEAFIGDRYAPVVLLSNNPGVREEGIPARADPKFMVKVRANLLHKESDWPFLFLAPDFDSPGKQWWVEKLKELIREFDEQTIARSIINIPFFPYPSPRYLKCDQLSSQKYSFRLVRESMERESVIVLMRERKGTWLDTLPDLCDYTKLCRLRNTQTPRISRGNLRDPAKFETMIAAIRDFRDRGFRLRA